MLDVRALPGPGGVMLALNVDRTDPESTARRECAPTSVVAGIVNVTGNAPAAAAPAVDRFTDAEWSQISTAPLAWKPVPNRVT